MNKHIKYIILILITVILIGCHLSTSNKPSNNSQTETIVEEERSNEDVRTIIDLEKKEEVIEFDNSIIPGEVAQFVLTEFDSLRFPFELDYDHYFYNGFGGDDLGSTLPYFCSGYFNNDSILDYAVVLIKDTTSQYVIAMIQNSSSFDYHLIKQMNLVPGDTAKGKFVSILIKTETDREAEHMFGTYYIDNESIGIDDMYKSLEYWATWSNDENQFIDLLFD